MRPSKLSQRQAFTLTELLVAIAIIALLASLLGSGISRAKIAANTVKCGSNLRQIYLAMQSYTADNDGRLPGPLRGGQPAVYHRDGYGPIDNFLPTFLASYLDLPPAAPATSPIAKVFVCPAWQAWSKNPTPDESIRIYIAAQSGVRMLDGTQGPPFGYPGTPPLEPAKIAMIDSPSKVPALYDLDRQNAPAYASDTRVPPTAIHGGKRNILFFDGHQETRSDIPTLP